MRRLKTITPPADYPVTLAEVLNQRVRESGEDDALLEMLIGAATERGEAMTNRQFCTATYQLTVEQWSATEAIELPRPPLQSVESIVAVADDGTEATLEASEYETITDTLVGCVRPELGKSWPVARYLRITFKAGWEPEDVPKSIKQWVMVRVGTGDEFREAVMNGRLDEMPRDFVDGLLDPFIVPGVV